MRIIDIAYFQQNAAFGATEEYLYGLAQNVDRSMFRVHVIFPDVATLERFSDLAADGVIVHRYPQALNSENALSAIIWLHRLFKQIKPELVHFNDLCIRGLLAAKLASVPISVVTHHTPELNRRYGWFGYITERLASLSRPYVIFTSDSDQETGVRKDGIPIARSRVIPYGLKRNWFESVDSPRARIRQEIGVPEDHTVLLSAGRLCIQKRHDILVEAARSVLENNSGVTFLLAGDGELRPSIEAQITIAGIERHFKLLGHRRDIASLMLASDIFVMSSDFEGLCYAVIEAAASGLPTVATNVGGLPLSVANNETGILVPPGDSLALARALQELIIDRVKRRTFGEEARRRAKRLFTLEREIKETENFYATLLTNRAALR